jgi:para-nitrobenzyl esterase
MSTEVEIPGPRTLSQAEADGQKFAESKGVNSLRELRAMSWQKLTEAGPGGPFASGPRFAPIVDRYLLPAPVREIFAKGKQNDVVTLTGANKDELGGFGPPQGPVTVDSFRKLAQQRYGEEADAFLKLYLATTDEGAKLAQKQSLMVTDGALLQKRSYLAPV